MTADAHVRKALVFEDGADVRKVKVDESGIDDEVCNAANTLFEDLVRDAERLDHRRVLGNDAGDLVVGDDDQRIDVFFEIFKPLDRVVHALFAFEIEGLGDDGDGQDLEVACDLRDDRCSARTGTAAHARRDEEQVGVLDRLGERFFALLGSRPAHFGISTRAETLGKSGPDLDLVFRLGQQEDLLVRIDGDIARALDARLDHTVDRVVARAADADDFYPCNTGQTVQTVKHLFYPPIPLNNL